MDPGYGRRNKREQRPFVLAGYTGQKKKYKTGNGDHTKNHIVPLYGS
jgi:hypothetical protein